MVQAAALTLAVFLGLTLFTFQTKIDFSFLVSVRAKKANRCASGVEKKMVLYRETKVRYSIYYSTTGTQKTNGRKILA